MKTTKAHFELFESECRYWLRALGLLGWDVAFTHTKIFSDDDNVSMAQTSANKVGRCARFYLGLDWGDIKPTDEMVARYAFHEVRELFYWRVEALALNRFLGRDEVREEVHNLIRTDENTLFEMYWEGRKGKK